MRDVIGTVPERVSSLDCLSRTLRNECWNGSPTTDVFRARGTFICRGMGHILHMKRPLLDQRVIERVSRV